MSPHEATKLALLSSPALLWDVSGARQEQQIPPAFSVRAMRSWLVSSWARYVGPLKVLPLGTSMSITAVQQVIYTHLSCPEKKRAERRAACVTRPQSQTRSQKPKHQLDIYSKVSSFISCKRIEWKCVHMCCRGPKRYATHFTFKLPGPGLSGTSMTWTNYRVMVVRQCRPGNKSRGAKTPSGQRM